MSDEEISIKVNICDRFYPLRIHPNEEEKIRKAAKNINEKAQDFIRNSAMQDKQDALALVALAIATGDTVNDALSLDINELNQKLEHLEQLLKP